MPVIINSVGRIFAISDSKAPLTLQKQGFEETPQSKSAENAGSAENADAKTRKMRKMQKMRMTGFNVTGDWLEVTPIWEKNLQGLKSWAWLLKFCRTFGVLCEGSSAGFL